MIVDLGESPPRAWSVTAESQSAHPGSAHWNDQLEDFVAGRYHQIPLDAGDVDAATVDRLVLMPAGGPAAR
jgi:penicillin amidase